MKKYRLGEIAEITSSKRIFEKEYVPSGIPFIRGQEITDGSIAQKSATFNCYISKERYNELKQTYGVPDVNDILITAVGTIGNLYLVEDDRSFYFKDGNIIWLRNIKSVVNPRYLFYYMKSDFFKLQLNKYLIGAVQKALTIVMLSNIEIELPSLSEQKRIASILSTLDRKIALNRQINDNLEAMAKQLYDYWFVQFDFPNEGGKPYKSSGGKMVWNEKLRREIPEGWEVDIVKNLIEPIERGISYTSKDIEKGTGIPMINLACFSKQGDYRVGELKFYGNDNYSRCVFPFDMLIACTDMTQGADVIGRPILATSEYLQYVYSMDLAKITPSGIEKMYLYYTLRTEFYHSYIKPFASGTNVKHLNINGVENYVLPIPDSNLQERFEELVRAIKEKQMLCINEILSLTKQRDELLPLLMNGQVTIAD